MSATPQFRPKPRSPKQRAIVDVLQKEPHITLAAAVALIGGGIYANAHVGALLANMVKKGMIKRLKPGVFTL